MEENKNLKLYPKYRRISMDFLFFYTINILFLTQIKHINMSAIVFVDTLYEIFVLLVQVPASSIVNKIGRKKSIILGNTFNALYLILIINSSNIIHLIIANFLCAVAFALKDIAEPSILNASINSTKELKSKIFSKIQGKAVSGYYLLSAISMVLSGFLYEINGYIPMFLSLAIVIITLIMSTNFDDLEVKESDEAKEEKVPFKEAVKFAFDSKRCKALLIYSAVFYGIITILGTYEIALLEDLGLSSKIIGILFATLNLVSSFSSNIEGKFQDIFKNRTLTTIGILLVLSCMISGSVAVLKIPITYIILIIFILYMIKYFCVGLYNVILIKYLSNFTNKKIDTQIFSINSFSSSIFGVIFGGMASLLIEYFSTANAMMLFGAISLVIMVVVLLYMRKRVGLKPEEYSEIELKYDEKA